MMVAVPRALMMIGKEVKEVEEEILHHGTEESLRQEDEIAPDPMTEETVDLHHLLAIEEIVTPDTQLLLMVSPFYQKKAFQTSKV